VKKLLTTLAVTALAATACGDAGALVVASVNTTDITVGEVESLIESESSVVPKDQFAEFLTFRIQWEIINQASTDDYAIEISDAEIDAEAERIYQQAKTGDQTREDFVASRGVTESFLLQIAQQSLLEDKLRDVLDGELPEPTQEEIDAARDEAAVGLTEVCLSHILVATEEEAQDVLDRIADGEDFGELAGELSQDPGSAASEGVLACGPAGQYVAEFRDAAVVAPIGEVYDTVVQTDFGFHVLKVTDRTDPAEEDLPTDDELIESLHTEDISAELETWFFDAIDAASVTVDPAYGTWLTDVPAGATTRRPRVEPPATTDTTG
jgi:foldase protein PrsA